MLVNQRCRTGPIAVPFNVLSLPYRFFSLLLSVPSLCRTPPAPDAAEEVPAALEVAEAADVPPGDGEEGAEDGDAPDDGALGGEDGRPSSCYLP